MTSNKILASKGEQQTSPSGEPRDRDITEGLVPDARAITVFQVPASARVLADDPVSFGMQELSYGDEEAAYEAAGENPKKAFELQLMRSLVEVNGRRLDKGKNEDEIHYRRWSSKCRKLAVIAFNRLHNTSEEEDAAFFASAERRT